MFDVILTAVLFSALGYAARVDIDKFVARSYRKDSTELLEQIEKDRKERRD